MYGNANTSDGTNVEVRATGSSTTTTYDQSKVNEANTRNQQQLQGVAQNMNRSYEATEQGMLKKVTLFPNDYVEGNIAIKLKAVSHADNLIVEIPFGGYVHRFNLNK